jgi:hypothetical protein
MRLCRAWAEDLNVRPGRKSASAVCSLFFWFFWWVSPVREPASVPVAHIGIGAPDRSSASFRNAPPQR